MTNALVSGLPNLKGKVHPDVEDALVRIYQQGEDVKQLLTNFQNTLAAYPSKADLLAHATRVEQAIATLPSYDAFAAGVSTSHIQQASILPIVVGALAYTSTTSSISWFWDGTNGSTLLTILFPNGISLPVPPANITVTGLAASTTYNFYAYYDVNFNAVIFFQNPSGVGTPPSAFTSSSRQGLQAVSADGHISLHSSTLQGVTVASGTGGGSGGGSGGSCVDSKVTVEPLGEHYYSYLVPEREWIELDTVNAHHLRASRDHRVLTEFGCLPMRNLDRSMRVVTREGLSPVTRVDRIEEPGKKRMVWVPKGNLYWANGVLCHNLNKN